MLHPIKSRERHRTYEILGPRLLVPLQRWKTIVQEINKDAYAKGRVIFDILSEPEAYGLRWETSNNASLPSLSTSYLRFMDMAHAINPSAHLDRLPSVSKMLPLKSSTVWRSIKNFDALKPTISTCAYIHSEICLDDIFIAS